MESTKKLTLGARRKLVPLALLSLVCLWACGRGVQTEGPLTGTLHQRTASHGPRRNLVIFVADGLRHGIVSPALTPEIDRLQKSGVSFLNSHSVYPTLTLVNASVFATGHFVADNGIAANTIFTGFPVPSAGGSEIPFLENDGILREVNAHFADRLLGGDTLLSAARAAGYLTAAVGKVGPTLIQELPDANRAEAVLVDDQTGTTLGKNLLLEIASRMTQERLPQVTPSRGDNGNSGDATHPGTTVANLVQQRYFVDVATKAVLPVFASKEKPFVLCFWSRDPDGTQHNQGDSLGKLVPGINGPTTFAALRNADDNLRRIRQALKHLGLERNTDIMVVSDHGFSTISRESTSSFAAHQSYPDVPPGQLPPGFLALDLGKALGLKVVDSDHPDAVVDPAAGKHPLSAFLGTDPAHPEFAVAANGGSDLIYLLPGAKPGRAREIVEALAAQDYVSGLFADDSLGDLPGTLPFSAIRLKGSPWVPRPSLIVSFRSFDTGCGDPTRCGVIVADTTLQQGQGNHGSFGRQDTYNFMAAVGPDFKQGFVDKLPAGNADVATTFAHLLGLSLHHEGAARGRVLTEVLAGAPEPPAPPPVRYLRSTPAANGLRTVLRYQELDGARYGDAAGAPGRTIGLGE